jgi:two-component system sensor histidine kinase ChvG
MPLRYQLLLLSLLTLLLPWAGCRYAREMETVLRQGQQDALLASASTMASFVASRPELLRAEGGSPAPFDPQAGDIYAYPLKARPLLDGYSDEWGLPEDATRRIGNPEKPLAVAYTAGVEGSYLYLLLRVFDNEVQLERTSDARLAPEERSDHVWLDFTDPAGLRETLLVATSAPGLISARRMRLSSYGERGEQLEPRIQAYWQPEADGYRLEARVPLAMVGSSFGFEVVDIADSVARSALPARAGTLDASRQATGRVLLPSVALSRELAPLLPPAARVAVADVNGWVLAEAGSVDVNPQAVEEYEEPAEWLQALYRNLLESGRERLPSRAQSAGRLEGEQIKTALDGRSGAAWYRLRDERRRVLSVATPIVIGADRVGVLMLEQAGDRLLTLRDQALTRLLNLTLLVTAGAVIAMLAFATYLGVRLARLKRAAETALTRDGRLNVVMPETASRDELGDLARSFDVLLRRLNEYTAYLRTLGGKLSHELRTPLAIVRSSLENLESERAAGASVTPYVERAREGTERLQAILTAMGAATRTEEAIAHAERTRFDLAELVRTVTAAYQDTFRERRFVARVSDGPCPFDGAPDLIVQLLDKLVENAVDFSASGGLIEIELAAQGPWLTLAVTNQGVPISPGVRTRLFDSMFEFRRDADSRPHFGLGLYIVRLVADFHAGDVFADNLKEGAGVRIGVRVPRPTGP